MTAQMALQIGNVSRVLDSILVSESTHAYRVANSTSYTAEMDAERRKYPDEILDRPANTSLASTIDSVRACSSQFSSVRTHAYKVANFRFLARMQPPFSFLIVHESRMMQSCHIGVGFIPSAFDPRDNT